MDESFLTVATNGVAGSGQAPIGVTVANGFGPVLILPSMLRPVSNLCPLP